MQNRPLLANVLLLITFFLASPALAQSEASLKPGWKKAWIASLLAVAGSTAFDAASSAGRYESNPLLRRADGTFNGPRALAIKGSSAGLMLVMQGLLARKHPDAYKRATILNAATAAAFTAIAARNLGVPKAATGDSGSSQ